MNDFESNILEIAKNVLHAESEAILTTERRLDFEFAKAVNAICKSTGRVIVCGIGKSGHIGKKIFATLISTGTPSFFLHPSEAFHGDLGMVLPHDIILAISNSGETSEIVKLVPFFKENGNLIVTMTGNLESSLAKASDYIISTVVEREACPLQLAPTTSTTVTLALGDALAICLMTLNGFGSDNFAKFHPGGELGRKLVGRVSDYMIISSCGSIDTSFKDLISIMTSSRTGVICILDESRLIGVVTDGDIRRAISENEISCLIELKASDLMSRNPKVISSDTKCKDADSLMNQICINSLIVNHNDKYFIYDNLNRRLK